MNDVYCGNCGEPYSYYYVMHELQEEPEAPEDADDYFLNGKGCPTCDWGDKDDVSQARTMDEDELELQRVKSILDNTDRDPFEFI